MKQGRRDEGFPRAGGHASPGTRARSPAALISGIGLATIGDSRRRAPLEKGPAADQVESARTLDASIQQLQKG